ncbi:SUKH-3 domain-containing protein [Streptomyces paromomycinus]|uniref:SUKH-3 domain containing protein n=1 Tax=Streptomyces paromomycinus TaxID=92743 RepID=A0A401W8X4_STREY|nr:SUKH-3 domain-containing protein [Streptomyces paromomycinus]GCD45761.1 hypothetical protein GKJPGBOP_05499 [Streptomyces paromomycinus]
MLTEAERREADELLASAGWYPGRDVSDRVPELVRFVVADLAAQECPVALSPAAEEFLKSYGFLDVEFPYDEGRTEHFNTCAKFCDDRAEEIRELSEGLQVPVFPVGWDSIEGGLAVIDPSGRFFYLHHTGFYYLGAELREAVIRLMNGRTEPAEEYYV